MLSNLFSTLGKLSAHPARLQQRPRRQRRVRRDRSKLEILEDRHLLTSTLFIDFGDAYAAGLEFTPQELTSLTQGPDFTQPGLAVQFASQANLTMHPLQLPGGGGSAIEIQNVRQRVLDLVNEALIPFDIHVEESAVSSVADIVDLQIRNAGDSTGEFDTWIGVGQLTNDTITTPACGDSVGCLLNLGGFASTADAGNVATNFLGANMRDEVALVFADQVTGPDFALALANNILHEAGHTWGLRHATNVSLLASQLIGSDILATESNDLAELRHMSRYPFELRQDIDVNVGGIMVNNYERLAGDADIGLRDDNHNGLADTTYITGTGLHDVITITQTDPDQLQVRLQPFSSTLMSHTDALVEFAYFIDLTATETHFVIDPGAGDDLVVIDGDFGAGMHFEIRDNSGANDQLRLRGNSTNSMAFTPDIPSNTNKFQFSSGQQIDFRNIEHAHVRQLGGFLYFAPTEFENVLQMDAAASGGLQIRSTHPDQPLTTVTLFDVDEFVFGATEGVVPDNFITVNGFQLVNGGQIELEPNSSHISATSFSADPSTSLQDVGHGVISSDQDQDHWLLPSAPTGQLVFAVSQQRTSPLLCDTNALSLVFGRPIGESTIAIAESEADGSCTQVIAGEIVPPAASGLTNLVVQPASDTPISVPYDLYYMVSDPGNPLVELEPNANFTGATPITPEDIINRRVIAGALASVPLDANSDRDLYSVFAPADSQIVVAVDLDPNSTGNLSSIRLDILDGIDGSLLPYDTNLHSTSDPARARAIVARVPRSGIYFIRIHEDIGQQVEQPYQFAVRVMEATEIDQFHITTEHGNDTITIEGQIATETVIDTGEGEDILHFGALHTGRVRYSPTGSSTQGTIEYLEEGEAHASSIAFVNVEATAVRDAVSLEFQTSSNDFNEVQLDNPRPGVARVLASTESTTFVPLEVYNVLDFSVNTQENGPIADNHIVVRPMEEGLAGMVEALDHDFGTSANMLPGRTFGRGSIASASDRDTWFVPRSDLNPLLFVFASNTGGMDCSGTDSTLQVRANGQILATDDDDGPCSSAAIAGLDISPPSIDGIYIDVASKPSSPVVTDYDLFVISAHVDDAIAESEPNGLRSAADLLPSDRLADGLLVTGNIAPPDGGASEGDIDIYEIFATQGAPIVVIADTNPDHDPTLTPLIVQVLDTDGETVLPAQPDGPISEGDARGLAVIAPRTGAYFLRIQRDPDASGEQNYRFAVQVFDAPGPFNNIVVSTGAGNDELLVQYPFRLPGESSFTWHAGGNTTDIDSLQIEFLDNSASIVDVRRGAVHPLGYQAITYSTDAFDTTDQISIDTHVGDDITRVFLSDGGLPRIHLSGGSNPADEIHGDSLVVLGRPNEADTFVATAFSAEAGEIETASPTFHLEYENMRGRVGIDGMSNGDDGDTLESRALDNASPVHVGPDMFYQGRVARGDARVYFQNIDGLTVAGNEDISETIFVTPLGIPIHIQGDDLASTLWLNTDETPGLTTQTTLMSQADTAFVELTTHSRLLAASDPIAAAGPESVVTMVNSAIAIVAKATGDTLAGPLTLSGLTGFFGLTDDPVLTTKGIVFDPYVLFDPHSERFIVVGLEFDRTRNVEFSNLHLAVSTSSTPTNLTTDWFKTSINVLDDLDGGRQFFDFPGLGVDENFVYLTGNMFAMDPDVLEPSLFQSHVSLLVLDKGALVDPVPSANVVARLAIEDDLTTLRPVLNYGGAPPDTAYFISADGEDHSLHLLSLDLSDPSNPQFNVGADGRLGDKLNVDVFQEIGNIAHPTGNLNHQSTTSNDARLMNAVFRDGAIWATHSVDANNDQSADVRWYRIDTNGRTGANGGNAPTIGQQGTIQLDDISAFFPSIGVNADNQVALGFSLAGSQLFTSSGYVTCQADPLTKECIFGDIRGLSSGTGPYATVGPPRPRWGDYSSISVDPVDQSFWVFNMHATQADLPAEVAVALGYPEQAVFGKGQWSHSLGNFPGAYGPANLDSAGPLNGSIQVEAFEPITYSSILFQPDFVQAAEQPTLQEGLTTFQQLLQALDQHGDFANNLQLIQSSLGDEVDMGQRFGELFVAPLANAMDEEELLATLAAIDAANPSITIDATSVDVLDGQELRIHLVLNESITHEQRPIEIDFTNLTESNLTADITYQLQLNATFGLTPVASGTREFFAEVHQLRAGVAITNPTDDGNGLRGITAVELQDLAQFVYQAELDVLFANPDLDPQDRLSRDELLGNSLTTLTTVAPADENAVHFVIPMQTEVGSYSTAGSTPTLTIASANPFDTTIPDHIWNNDANELATFHTVSPFDIATRLQNLGNWFSELTDIAPFDSSLPFVTSLDVDALIDLQSMFDDVIGQYLFAAPNTPNFSSIQELAGLLPLTSLDYDPASDVITFSLALAYSESIPADLAIGFDLGDAAGFSSAATLEVNADANVVVTFGIDLTPLGTGFTLSPLTPLSDLNAGLGVPTAPGAELAIQFRDGSSWNVDITGIGTVGQLLTLLNSDLRLTAELQPETDSLRLHDNTVGTATFGIDIGTSLASGALGLFGTDDDQDGTLDGMPLHGDRIADHFYIDELVLNGDISITGTNISAELNLLGVEVLLDNGTLNLASTLNAALIDPGSPTPAGTLTFDGRITANELAGALVGNPTTNPPITSLSLIPNASMETLEANLVFETVEVSGGFPGVVPADPVVSITLEDVTDLSTAQLDHNLNLSNVPDLDLDIVFDALREAADFVNDLLRTGPLDLPLPVVNQSLGDLLDATGDLHSALNQLDQPGVTLANLQTELPGLLGISPQAFDLQYNNLTNIVDISLTFDKSQVTQLPIELDLAAIVDNAGNVPALEGIANLVDTSGSALIDVEFDANIDVDLQLDLSNPGNPIIYLRDTTHVAIGMAVTGSNLDFQAAVGPLGVFVENGTVVFDIDGNGPLDNGGSTESSQIELTLPIDNADHRYTMGELPGIVGATDVDLTAGIYLDLPLYFPTAATPLGGAGANSLEISIDNLTAFLQGIPGSVVVDAPNLSLELDNFALLDNLYVLVDGVDWMLGKLQAGFDSNVLDVVLPFLGDKLRDSARFVEDLREDIVQPLSDILQDTPPTPGTLQQALFDILGPIELGGLGILSDSNGSGTITPADVNFVVSDTSGDGENDDILFEFDLFRSYVFDGPSIGFDIGLPALGLEVMSDIEFQLSYDWHIAFGVNESLGFYVDTTQADELDLGIQASVPGFMGEGRLGFLDLDIVDQGSALAGSFIVDLVDPDGKLTMSEFVSGSAALRDIIVPRIEADADVNLGLRLSFGGNPVFPSLVSEFVMHWDLATVELGGDAALGGVPEIAFNNIGIDLGTFISDFASPLLERLSVVLDPMKPVVDALQFRVPVLSDIEAAVQLFDDNHDGDVNLIEVANQLGIGGDATEYVIDFLKVYDIYERLQTSALPGPGENLIINLGDFAFGGLDTRSLDSLENVAIEDLAINAIQDVLDQLPEGVSQFADDAIDFFSSLDIDLGFGLPGPADEGIFKFPLFEEPTSAFRLLLGQDVELVTYNMRPLEFNVSLNYFFPVLYFLGVEMDGSLGAQADFAFGYDTAGFRDFAAGGFQNPLDILNGFYISDRENTDGTGADIPEIKLWGDVSLAAAINAVVASVSVGGGIEANIDGNLNDVDNDGKFRVDDLVVTFPKCMLDISGAFSAGAFAKLKIGLGELSVTKRWDIARKTLASFNYACEGLLDPVLATDLGNGDLRLNLGPNAGARVHGDTNGSLGEVFEVEWVSGPAGNETVLVSAFGYEQQYTGVSRILGYGGGGDDVVTISDQVRAAVEIDGDAGNDQLVAGGGSAILRGGEGDDELSGGLSHDVLEGNDGNDILIGLLGNDLLRGGFGDDALYGDDGNDTLYGEQGADVIYAGAGADSLWGGPDDDELDGGDDDDRIYGEDGNDKVTAGTGNDSVEGNDGHDELLGEHGNDTILGGAGNDIIYAGRGNDIADGNSGNDELHGEEEADTLFGNRGRDTITGGDGDDVVHGGSGNDTLEGNAGADDIQGDGGDDTIFGNDGDDTLSGGDQDDRIEGGQGNDIVYGGTGHDELLGQQGDDAIEGNGGQDILDGGDGNDNLLGGSGIDYLTGGPDNDTMSGESGDDQLFGDAGNDIMDGGPGRDQLWGAIGTDTLYGGDDADLIVGADGSDTLLGGWGVDVIIGHLIGDNVSTAGEYIEGGPDDDYICGTTGIDTIYGGTSDYGYEHYLNPPVVPTNPLTGGFAFVSCSSTDIPAADFEYEPDIADGFLITTSSIRGHKRVDLNGDGTWDPQEPALGNVTIYLDANNNGQYDASERATMTAIDGSYHFEDLTPGQYFVREVTPLDMAVTFPFARFHSVELSAGDVADNVDFANGLFGRITGTKWSDSNGNGVRDTSDGGIPNVRIYLDLNHNGALDAGEPNTQTNATGNYLFSNVAPGNYTVREQVPNNYIPTYPAGYLPQSVQVLPGFTTSSVDFGNYEFRTIDGMKWADMDADGVRDAGEPGLSGVTIYVDLNHNATHDAHEPFAITIEDDPNSRDIDETGMYRITHVPRGLLDVREVTPVGYQPSFPSLGYHSVDLRSATDVPGVNFGNVPLTEIHGRVWNDLNGNGIHSANEPGMPQIRLYLDLNANSQWDASEPEASTQFDDHDTSEDEAGRYSFTNLPLGSYIVRELLPTSHTMSFPPARSHTVTFTEPGFIEGLEFGNFQHAEVRGTSWIDLDGDRIFDAIEVGRAGVTVYADLNNNREYDPNEPATVTLADNRATPENESGRYVLTGLVAGDYTLRQLVPYQYRQSFPISAIIGGDGMSPAHRISLTPGQIRTATNFGLRPQLANASSTVSTLASSAVVVPVGTPQHNDANPALQAPGNFLDIDLSVIIERIAQLRNSLDGDDMPVRGPLDTSTLDFGDLPAPYPTLAAENGPRHLRGTSLTVALGTSVDVEKDGQPTLDGRGDDLSGTDDEDGIVFVTPLVKGSNATMTARTTSPGYLNAWIDVNGDGDWNDAGEKVVADQLLAAGVTPLIFAIPTTNAPGVDVPRTGARFRYSSAPGLSFEGPAADGEVEDYVVAIGGATSPPWNTNVSVNDPNVIEGNVGTTNLTWTITLSAAVGHPVTVGYRALPATATEDVDYLASEGTVLIPAGATSGQVHIAVVGDLIFEASETLQLELTDVTGAVISDPLGTGTILNDDSPSSTRVVEGYKWRDSNSNRTRDASEQGEPGFAIFADVNQNSIWEFGEPITITMDDNPLTLLVDEAGYYQLAGVPSGAIQIRELVPNGWLQTFPVTGFHTVNVAPGATVSNINFGNTQQLPDGDDLVFAAAGNDRVNGDNLITIALVQSVGTRMDELHGESGNDRLFGQEQDDLLIGGEGADTLDGGDGTDRVIQTVNANQVLTNGLLTGQGPDTLVSLERATLTGGAGNNTIDASGFSLGPVILVGMDGNDQLIATSFNDELTGGNGSDTLEGREGNDLYQFASVSTEIAEVDTLIEIAGQGSDILDFSLLPTNDPLIIDLSSREQLTFGMHALRTVTLPAAHLGNQPSFTLVRGGEGDDLLIGNDEVNQLFGNGGSDQLHGGLANDSLQGNAGDDIINGGANNDVLSGGAGNDNYQFDTNWGIDLLVDNAGFDDHVDFSSVPDNLDVTLGPYVITSNLNRVTSFGDVIERLTLGSGNDTVHVPNDGAGLASGNGVLEAGLGTDLLDYSLLSAAVSVVVDLQSQRARGFESVNGIENVTGGAGDDNLRGDMADNWLSGGPGDDTLEGHQGNDTLAGGADNDTLLGNAGNDTLDGGAGNDDLTGGWHDDMLQGGVGNDIYRFEQPTPGEVDSLVELLGEGAADTLDLRSNGRAITLDMTDTVWLVGQTSGRELQVAGNSGEIETILGTPFDDHFIVAGPSLTIAGGQGDDHYEFPDATTGVFTLQELPDQGIDGIHFDSYSTDIIMDLSNVLHLPSAGLTITTIAPNAFEELVGGTGNDTLSGHANTTQIVGGAGNDRITALAQTVVFDGGTGDDEYILPANATNVVLRDPGDLAGGVDTIDLAALTQGVTIDLYNFQPQIVSPNGVTLWIDALIEHVIGTPFADSFATRVREQSQQFDGGLPVAGLPPGDTLVVEALRAELTLGDGQLTADGFGTIGFVNIETIRHHNASAIYMSAAARANDNLQDNFSVSRDGDDTLITSNDGVRVRALAIAMPHVTILGSADDDSLIVSFVGGNPIPNGLTYEGASQSSADVLEIIGSGLEEAEYQPDPDQFGNGTISVDGSTIVFTGLEPVVVHGLAAIAFIPQGSVDDIRIDAPMANRNRIAGRSDGVLFEELVFYHVGHVTLDLEAHDATGSGIDQLLFVDDLVATLLQSFVIRSSSEDIVDASMVTRLAATHTPGFLRFRQEETEGDFNQDGSINSADIDQFSKRARAGTRSLHLDLTNDGVVDRQDHLYLVEQVIGTRLGDANLDHRVDANDFQQWNLHRFAEHASWDAGDFNGDGVVDVSDFNAWNQNKFVVAGGQHAGGVAPSRPTPRAAATVAPPLRTAVAADIAVGQLFSQAARNEQQLRERRVRESQLRRDPLDQWFASLDEI